MAAAEENIHCNYNEFDRQNLHLQKQIYKHGDNIEKADDNPQLCYLDYGKNVCSNNSSTTTAQQ